MRGIWNQSFIHFVAGILCLLVFLCPILVECQEISRMQPQVSASASRESETLRLEEDMVHHVARPANGYRLQSALLRKGVRSASKDESMAYLYLVLSMLFKVAVISYCIFSLFKLVYPLIYQIQRIIADFLHHMDGKKDEFLFLTA